MPALIWSFLASYFHNEVGYFPSEFLQEVRVGRLCMLDSIMEIACSYDSWVNL